MYYARLKVALYMLMLLSIKLYARIKVALYMLMLLSIKLDFVIYYKKVCKS